MNWVQLLSAIGFGALLTKLMDVLWLQKIVRENEYKKWLRDKKLEAYSELTQEILSMGTRYNTREDPYKGYALTAKAALLVEDENLALELEEYFTNVSNLYTEGCRSEDDPAKKPEEELDIAYNVVLDKSRGLVSKLRQSLSEK